MSKSMKSNCSSPSDVQDDSLSPSNVDKHFSICFKYLALLLNFWPQFEHLLVVLLCTLKWFVRELCNENVELHSWHVSLPALCDAKWLAKDRGEKSTLVHFLQENNNFKCNDLWLFKEDLSLSDFEHGHT